MTVTVNKIFDIRKCTKIIKTFKWFYLYPSTPVPTPKMNCFLLFILMIYGIRT